MTLAIPARRLLMDDPFGPRKGLGLWLPMRGNALDATGRNAAPTVAAPTLTTDHLGRSNRSYLFDFIDDYIRFAQATPLDLVGNQISMAAWFLFNQSGVYQRIIAKAVGGPTFSGFAWELVATNVIRVRLGNGTDAASYDTTTTITTGVWQHWAWTWDGTNVRYYLNGVLDLAVSGARTVTNSTVAMDIGSLAGANPFGGRIADLRLCQRTLAPQEVWRLYQTRVP